MTALAAIARLGQQIVAAIGRSWSQFWFQPRPTTVLEIVRIGIGAALLFHYTMATPFLFEFWGDSGWMPPEIAREQLSNRWMQSVFFYFTSPWQWTAFHAFFLICCTAFTLGWRTSWVKWIVLIGLISYDYRNFVISYGAGSIAVSLVFVLCLAPTGRSMSLDRLRAVRAAKRADLAAVPPTYFSPWAGACIRLLQLQMVVLFFVSGAEKIRGDMWWWGDALWVAFSVNEFYNGFVLWLFARQYWLVTLGTYATILIELAYAFLIWRRRTRPYLLAAAVWLHLNFMFLLGLVYFSVIMIMGHMSFLRQEWLATLALWWKRKIGDMEMVYDGRCGFCVRSMAWFLAFDGLQQITSRDFRTNPSPIVSDEKLEKALYLVLPDGRALPGFEAYRYVVLRVPGLWWLVPFFYVPLISRLFGPPIYNWIAANRSRLSAMRWPKLFRSRRAHANS